MANAQNNTHTQPSKQTDESDFWFLKFATSTIASLTLILILLGFGVSLAVESKLSLPHSSLYDSSVELLDLGSVAVVEMLPKLFSQIGEGATYLKMIADVWKTFWVFLAIYVVIVPFVFYLKYVKKVDFEAIKLGVKTRLAESDAKGFVVKASLVLIMLLASSLLPIIGYFGLLLCFALLSTVPMIGWVAGSAYVHELAIHDHACSPLPSVQYYEAQKAEKNAKETGETKKELETVECVKVMKDGSEVARGRLVLSTSKAVVLYLPDGIARRVPISDQVIEVVDELGVRDPVN